MQELLDAWTDFQGNGWSDTRSVLRLGLYLTMGGLLAIYIRFLYDKCSESVSDTGTVSRVFPLLTIVTIGVIAVVKSSLALSLGLVGALSIVRFRAAIKEPEELVFLFLCIGVGLALGAELPQVALVLVVVATVFVLMGRFLTRGKVKHNMLITVSGDAVKYFSDPETGALGAVKDLKSKYSIQRFDIEGERGQIRLIVGRTNNEATIALIASLRRKLPECEVSYVNIDHGL